MHCSDSSSACRRRLLSRLTVAPLALQSAVRRRGSNDTAFPWRSALYRVKARCTPAL